MGRHAVSSSLRTPAVLVGVPVATVLATFGTTAVLGGVVPSAQELPLRAEAPGDVVPGPDAAVPQGAPTVPGVSFDTSLLPTAVAQPAPAPRVVPTATRTAAATTAAVADGRPAVGPRVIRVAPAVASVPAAGPRVLDADADADDDLGDDDVTSTVVPGPRRDAEPRIAPRAVTAASPVETVAARSSDETTTADRTEADGSDGADGSVVDLDTPSGGLSLLTFG